MRYTWLLQRVCKARVCKARFCKARVCKARFCKARVCKARFCFKICSIVMVCLFVVIRHFQQPVRNFVVSLVTPFQFYSYLSPREKALLLDTFDVFKQKFEMAGVAYFICGGTLMGSYRHHGFIPWDDDIDVYISLTDKPQVKELLGGLPGYVLNSDADYIRWKFYPTAGSATIDDEIPWKLPFLDINFYLQNQTHIWDVDTSLFSEWFFRIEDVFPLVERPFEGRMVPAPRKALLVLQEVYGGLETCKASTYSHRTESLKWFYWMFWEMPCAALSSRFPFVRRVPNRQGGCNEYLTFNNKYLAVNNEYLIVNNKYLTLDDYLTLNKVVKPVWMKHDVC